MQQPPPVGAETAIDDHAELFVMGLAHVLQHTDGDEGVAVSLDGAVIGLDELNTPFYSLAACTLARIRDLLAREVIHAQINLKMTRHVERERPPTTTDNKHKHTQKQTQFAADVFHLRLLRLLEWECFFLKILAVLHQFPVHPELIKCIADIV